ncbi:hypothetical protein B0H17DRAFT_1135092 [Mycena rosella]|uniref:Uncharacterized protein n=1 Tax=Mycena rosella TaxID=1033263 RepID=A0AAD7GDA5_MYCRO|nr:hypothetical protein B0H17DRAFT_1135092 [Mycena rosella]
MIANMNKVQYSGFDLSARNAGDDDAVSKSGDVFDGIELGWKVHLCELTIFPEALTIIPTKIYLREFESHNVTTDFGAHKSHAVTEDLKQKPPISCRTLEDYCAEGAEAGLELKYRRSCDFDRAVVIKPQILMFSCAELLARASVTQPRLELTVNAVLRRQARLTAPLPVPTTWQSALDLAGDENDQRWADIRVFTVSFQGRERFGDSWTPAAGLKNWLEAARQSTPGYSPSSSRAPSPGRNDGEKSPNSSRDESLPPLMPEAAFPCVNQVSFASVEKEFIQKWGGNSGVKADNFGAGQTVMADAARW